MGTVSCRPLAPWHVELQIVNLPTTCPSPPHNYKIETHVTMEMTDSHVITKIHDVIYYFLHFVRSDCTVNKPALKHCFQLPVLFITRRKVCTKSAYRCSFLPCRYRETSISAVYCKTIGNSVCLFNLRPKQHNVDHGGQPTSQNL